MLLRHPVLELDSKPVWRSLPVSNRLLINTVRPEPFVCAQDKLRIAESKGNFDNLLICNVSTLRHRSGQASRQKPPRGLDIDQLPHVVNFELPNVPEDYVHRIGRTGRAGSMGAAISLVDREEFSFLKDIERLIKREIPVVAVDSFVPPTHFPAEAPRPPRQAHGQRRNNAPRAAGNRNQPRREEQNPREGQNKMSRNPQPRTGQPPRANQQTQNGKQPGKPRQPQKITTEQQHLSEAARHQAMPQPALFSPKPGVRRGH